LRGGADSRRKTYDLLG